MDLGDVMQAIADRLDTIDGLRVYAFPPDVAQPPAAIVGYPEVVTYDNTYGRGSDVMTISVVVVDGRPTDRAVRDRITQYASGSGATSIKAVLESGSYTAFGTIRVANAEFDMVTIAAVDYLAVIFECNISGRGA